MSGRTWLDMPGWLRFDVRRHHALAVMDGAGAAGEDAVSAITDRVLDEDPEFARVLVARYVRSLVRAAPAAGKRPVTEKQKRKASARKRLAGECAALSDAGTTLRDIGEAKSISRQTVANLIAEWLMSSDAARSRQSLLSRNGADLTAEVDKSPNVIPLRRLA
jgi:hypothetical protein